MKDKMKDFEGLVKDQKPNGTDVKCAEIKTLHTGLGEKPKFKIGEYNRATASFEMNSVEDVRPKEVKPKFDFSSDVGPCHYFKSSFARSVVVNSSHRSKSLEYNFMNRNGCAIKEESSSRVERRNSGSNDYEERSWIPGKENWDLRRAQPAEVRDDESTSGSLLSPVSEEPSLKKSEVIEEHLRSQGLLAERPASSAGSACQRLCSGGGERRLDDLLLRSPLTASCRSSFNRSYSSASDVDSVLLQSQVTTLQWQLRQAEASRQMYRAVLEEVVSFLQKTHKDLDLLQNRLDDSDVENVTRVSRSRSVHAVDTSPTRVAGQRSEGTLSFQKAKSFAQIGGDPDCPKHGAMFREASWRRTRKQLDADEGIPSKLSEEAFRLLRTVKSLLGTKEPDLASRLSATCSSPANVADVSSASSTVSATLDSDHSDHFPPPQVPLRDAKNPPNPPAGGTDPRRGSKGDVEAKGSPPQLSISSADDESGFSSLNSFQEIGLPLSNSTFIHRGGREESKHRAVEGFQEVGLPKVDEVACKVHRRWSSTPSDSLLPKLRPPSLCTNGDVIKVLWV